LFSTLPRLSEFCRKFFGYQVESFPNHFPQQKGVFFMPMFVGTTLLVLAYESEAVIAFDGIPLTMNGKPSWHLGREN
jgi:hypothetical protein